MRSFRRLKIAVFGTALGSFLALLVAPPGGADSAGIRSLRQENASLAQQSQSALVELYSLESRLREQRARVDSLRVEVDAVSAERASVRHRLMMVRRVFRLSQQNLGRRLVQIYEQGEPNTLAILLG